MVGKWLLMIAENVMVGQKFKMVASTDQSDNLISSLILRSDIHLILKNADDYRNGIQSSFFLHSCDWLSGADNFIINCENTPL